jgi:recombination protein RecT
MAVNNSLVQRPGNGKPQTFSAFLTSDAIKHRINNMVGGKDGQRFISAVISAVSVNPGLTECEHSTILSAALLGESLKLSPSPQLGQYYMVPFNDKKRGTKVAQFQLGYKGYIQLAIRSGQYKKLNVLAIKQGELVSYDPLEEDIKVNLIEDEQQREAAPTIGYYAMFEYTNGFKKTMYWSREKMMAHADRYSMAFSAQKYQDLLDGKIPQSEMWKYSSFWYKDFDGMAYKTMLRQLISRWGIMSIDLQTAMDKDMAAIHEDGTVDYVDNSVDYGPASNDINADPTTGEVIDMPQDPQEEDPTAGFFNN